MNATSTAQQTDVIRLLILDDHPLVREGIGRLLEAEADIQVTGQCATVGEAFDTIRTIPCDIVLLDYDLGPERGSEFLARVRQDRWEGRILVITAGVTDRQAIDLLASGADGIFHKTNSPELLVQAIRQVMRGERWLGEPYRQRLEQGIAEPAGKKLSSREQEVLRRVVEGLANKEIAARLNISESSVKAALQQLFLKTGVRTRSQLVRLALERYREEVL
jgi:DNA-binding NarL/FixJ family response regulator